MSIEISQFSINTTIVNNDKASAPNQGSDEQKHQPDVDFDLLRESILKDCKAMISDMLERQTER